MRIYIKMKGKFIYVEKYYIDFSDLKTLSENRSYFIFLTYIWKYIISENINSIINISRLIIHVMYIKMKGKFIYVEKYYIDFSDLKTLSENRSYFIFLTYIWKYIISENINSIINISRLIIHVMNKNNHQVWLLKWSLKWQ